MDSSSNNRSKLRIFLLWAAFVLIFGTAVYLLLPTFAKLKAPLAELRNVWVSWAAGTLDVPDLWGKPLWWWNRCSVVLSGFGLLGVIVEIIGADRLRSATLHVRERTKVYAKNVRQELFETAKGLGALVLLAVSGYVLFWVWVRLIDQDHAVSLFLSWVVVVLGLPLLLYGAGRLFYPTELVAAMQLSKEQDPEGNAVLGVVVGKLIVQCFRSNLLFPSSCLELVAYLIERRILGLLLRILIAVLLILGFHFSLLTAGAATE